MLLVVMVRQSAGGTRDRRSCEFSKPLPGSGNLLSRPARLHARPGRVCSIGKSESSSLRSADSGSTFRELRHAWFPMIDRCDIYCSKSPAERQAIIVPTT